MESNKDNRLALRAEDLPIEPEVSMQQPRQPRNMEDLLRYAIEAESRNPSAQSHPDVGPLDPARREFLENVISSMTVDVVKELKSSLSVLEKELAPGDSPEKFEDAFEQILDFVDNIDVSNDFFKLGGFEVCKKWLEKGPPGVRWRAASVIGECCQNNPFCQSEAIASGFLKMLMDLTQNDPNEMVKLKSFHAVSSIVRNNDNTLLNFLTLNGHKLILHCLKSPSYRLKTKASFLTSAIANKEAMFKEQLWDIGVADELSLLICSSRESRLAEDVSCFEQCLLALLTMIKGSKKRLEDEKKTIESLSQLTELLKDEPPYIESVECIKSILQILDGKN